MREHDWHTETIRGGPDTFDAIVCKNCGAWKGRIGKDGPPAVNVGKETFFVSLDCDIAKIEVRTIETAWRVFEDAYSKPIPVADFSSNPDHPVIFGWVKYVP